MRKVLFISLFLSFAINGYSQWYNSKGGTHKGYNTPYTQQQQQISSWSGSGIALNRDHVATNHHVVDGATNLYVHFPEIDKDYVAEVITVDSTNDLAIIKITDPNFKGFDKIKYGFKAEVEDIGVGVFVLGYPMVQTMGTEVKLTTGVVSSRSGYQGNRSQYQISAPIQPGNSGGPLFNDDGELIGIISAKHTEAENVGYGVKLDYLRRLADSVGGIELNQESKLTGLPLSDKCKSIIPFTVMIKANNAPAEPSHKAENTPKQKSSNYTNGVHIKVNKPFVEECNTNSAKIYAIEVTGNYTALYMTITNNQYEVAGYNVSEDIYIMDKNTGNKYELVSIENCAIYPQQTEIRYGETKLFTLFFQPISHNVPQIDLIEPGDAGWKFYGIDLR